MTTTILTLALADLAVWAHALATIAAGALS